MIRKLYFIGAGSTATLKIPTTCGQNEELKKIIWDSNDNLEIDNSDFSISLLRKLVTNFFTKTSFDLNQVYNLIDSHLKENKCISFGCNENLDLNELRVCRNTMIFIVFKLFYDAIKEHHKEENIQGFYEKLARKALDKKLKEYNKENAKKRDFIFTDYAIINLNWDLYSILPMLQAHQKINNENNYYLPEANNAKLKIFNDFGMYMACNTRDNQDIWYPYNESAATRVNNPEYKCNRVVTLTRAYFPHGLMNLYQCKFCKKHVLNIGDLEYDSLLKKENIFQNKKIMTCPFCKNDIKEFDVDFLNQTNYKIISPYLQEIRYEMNLALQETKEVIFIGYSLPIDDIDYNTIFSCYLRKDGIKVKVVLYDKSWINNEFKTIDINNCNLSDNNKQIVKRYQQVFGEKVLFNFIGSPCCFENDYLY